MEKIRPCVISELNGFHAPFSFPVKRISRLFGLFLLECTTSKMVGGGMDQSPTLISDLVLAYEIRPSLNEPLISEILSNPRTSVLDLRRRVHSFSWKLMVLSAIVHVLDYLWPENLKVHNYPFIPSLRWYIHREKWYLVVCRFLLGTKRSHNSIPFGETLRISYKIERTCPCKVIEAWASFTSLERWHRSLCHVKGPTRAIRLVYLWASRVFKLGWIN